MPNTPTPLEVVDFQITTVNVDDHPFELMLNTLLPGRDIQIEFNWLWTITLGSIENDAHGLPVEKEREVLARLMMSIIRAIAASHEIKILGTSLFKGQYEVMFYAKEEEQVGVGAVVVGLPEEFTDSPGRFRKFSGAPDPDWEKAKNYYLAFKSPGVRRLRLW